MLKDYKYPDGSLISFMSNKVKSSGGINLAQGIPSYDPPVELKNILSNLALGDGHQYPPGVGDFDLIEQILNHYNKEYNESISSENLLVTQGATEGIYLTYQYIKHLIGGNCSVLAFNPLYESYKYLPRIFNDNLHVADLQVIISGDIHEVRKIILENDIKIVFLASPGNPYGKAIGEDAMRKMIELAEELDFYIVYDAVYKDLYFNEKIYVPLEPLSERIFYLNSFSKMLSITGWRVGYIICHKLHKSKLRYIHDYTGLCAPSILQKAIAIYLKNSNFADEYLNLLRKKLKESYESMSRDLMEVGFEIPEIDGGYFIWAKLPNEEHDSFQWVMNLYEQLGVAAIPGMHFSDTDIFSVRFNIARQMDEIKLAGNKIKQFCNTLTNS